MEHGHQLGSMCWQPSIKKNSYHKVSILKLCMLPTENLRVVRSVQLLSLLLDIFFFFLLICFWLILRDFWKKHYLKCIILTIARMSLKTLSVLPYIILVMNTMNKKFSQSSCQVWEYFLKNSWLVFIFWSLWACN